MNGCPMARCECGHTESAYPFAWLPCWICPACGAYYTVWRSGQMRRWSEGMIGDAKANDATAAWIDRRLRSMIGESEVT